MVYSDIRTLCGTITESISRVIIGREQETRLVLAVLLAGGHVLLEDVPGTGKTTLAKSLARSLDCAFSRVQFTPDLLPADVTGMRVYSQQTGEFTFIKGPVFTGVLLADEINRATPRTQSALLECMEERQVTEGGVTYPLPSPFFVIATQNPVETQGTFPLPEAQLDRFMLRLSLGYPTQDEAVALMRRFITGEPLAELTPCAAAGQIAEAASLVRTCRVSEDVMRYMAALCEAARSPEKALLGPSPRALLALMRCSQALAAISGRDYVIPDDVKSLAVPVLAHRIILRGMYHGDSAASFVEDCLARTAVPTEARA
ncbi:MAG: MoxR family ATPase [Clostridia bacterium]|nr:MoxR family ATPase [Clostridia bacterium]